MGGSYSKYKFCLNCAAPVPVWVTAAACSSEGRILAVGSETLQRTEDRRDERRNTQHKKTQEKRSWSFFVSGGFYLMHLCCSQSKIFYFTSTPLSLI